MKKSLIAAAVTGVLIFGAAIASADDTQPKATQDKPTAPNPACLTHTGSRIPAKGMECVEIGHSYDAKDISRTGATSAGGALRLMDPTVTIHQ